MVVTADSYLFVGQVKAELSEAGCAAIARAAGEAGADHESSGASEL